jgi:hypothetical protein
MRPPKIRKRNNEEAASHHRLLSLRGRSVHRAIGFHLRDCRLRKPATSILKGYDIMAEHRPVLDPSILARMASSMDSIREAWEADVAEIRRQLGETENLRRDLTAAIDRAELYQVEMQAAKDENRRLIEEKAHLEAQVQKLTENSLDARDMLGALAVRAAESVRNIPSTATGAPVTAAEVARPGEISDEPEDDGTGLSQESPTFLRRTAIPINEFTPNSIRSGRSLHPIAAE